MEQKLIKFPNKFQAVICNVDSKMVSVSVSINVGAELEPKGKSGIAHLVERLIRSNIYSKVAEYGGVVDTKTDFERIEFVVSTQSEYLENAMKDLSECIFDFYPKFVNLEREKVKITQEQEKESFNPMSILNNLTQKYIYKGTNLSTTILGTAKSIQGITLDDVRDFVAGVITPESINISIVGDIVGIHNLSSEDRGNLSADFDFVQSFINKYFYIRVLEKDGKRKGRSTPTVVPVAPIYIGQKKSLNQTRFQISFPTSPYESVGYKYTKIFEMYLGLYLRIELSKTAGVYGMEVATKQFKNNSHISISFAVDGDIANEVYEKVFDALMRLKDERVSKKDFETLVVKYKTEVALNHLQPNIMASRYNKWLFIKGELFDINTELKEIGALSYENFITTCQLTLDFSKVVVIAIGKLFDFEPFRLINGGV